jgi:hypothetical protein
LTYIKRIYVVYAFNVKCLLENTELYSKVFFWILAEVVDQLRAFAGELVEIGSGLIDVVEERLVGDELAESSLTGLGVAEN